MSITRLSTSSRTWLLAALGLVVLVVLTYWPGLHGGFVFDDFPNIVDNARVKIDSLTFQALSSAAFSSDAGSLQRPIAMLTFAVNHYFTGMDPSAMKWTNLIIHATNALLVLGLAWLVITLAMPEISAIRRRWAALFVASAWSLNPINYFGVLYVVQRMESLSHLFVFAGLWLYLLGRQRQLRGEKGRWLIGIGLVAGTALAMLCKESGVLLPLYAWLMEICLPVLRRSADRNRVQRAYGIILWFPCALGLTWLVPRVLRPGAFATRDFTLVDRLLTEPRVLFDYIEWTLLPRLNVLGLYHDDYIASRGLLSPPTTILALAGIMLLAILAWWLRGRRPLCGLGILWFLAGHAMTATIIPLELVFEHRNYFSSVGLCLALADCLLLWPTQESMRRIGLVAAALALIYYASVTHLRAREWSDPLRFARSEAIKHPRSPRATYGYARMLVIASDYKRDSTFLGPAVQALDQARRLPKSGVLPHSAFLLTAAHTGMPIPDDWWDDLTARLRLGPIGPQEINAISSLVRCSRSRECTFPVDRMTGVFEAAIARRPMADLYTLYGDYTLNVLHRPEDAIALSRKAIEARPDVAQYRVNIAMQLIYVGRVEEARREIAALREMGALGQNEAAAQALEDRIRDRGPL